MWPFRDKKKEYKTVQIIQANYRWTDIQTADGEDLAESFSFILKENDYGEREVDFDSYGYVKSHRVECHHPLYRDTVLPWLHYLEDIEPEKEKRKIIIENKDNIVYLKEEKSD